MGRAELVSKFGLEAPFRQCLWLPRISPCSFWICCLACFLCSSAQRGQHPAAGVSLSTTCGIHLIQSWERLSPSIKPAGRLLTPGRVTKHQKTHDFEKHLTAGWDLSGSDSASSLLKVSRDVNLADALSCILGLGPHHPWVGGNTPPYPLPTLPPISESLVIRRQQVPKPRHGALLEYKAGRVTKEAISVQLTHCVSSVCPSP